MPGRVTPAIAMALGLCACQHVAPPPAPPQVAPRVQIDLPPPPARPLTVGVYSCVDTSGQRRPTQLPQELSTAAPMDCTPYVIRAVRDLRPGYVLLVERQHVDELLRERQLATLALNMNGPALELNGQAQQPSRRLSTLRVAEILLIGQVVAYDRSVREASGGVAVGAGAASGAYVTDLVTFSLRAVAVQSGEILGETTVTKQVTSLRIGGHLARIFDTTSLDAELGGAVNEPVGIAIAGAARAALIQLIRDGVAGGWWT
ncbi:CsgG/HfaB family protein [Phenylobacterium sp.]|uniref:CsgG/HfaB family protein n=1 Tax=Phenylobacterium sp. TaxID=1871053 RepID=UPI0025FDEBE4|nr:CsgG/HfaB family protein [Phenylobacterium sp.]